ncbi:DUF5992 family protein [Hahella ganghwensis]|uniref:DUF5992 family protein n=1 Tax=Hahella ganghwensis TaxID=286420 RepID=UPI00037A0F6A|nr:DUF5992 family protein [Hahella ganghwensis]
MKKIILSLLFVSVSAQADWLVKDADIIEISNTAGNAELFYIHVSGGEGLCANKQIRFPLSAAGSEKVYDRAFSIALAAYLANQKVKVYDYDEGNEDCKGAESIRLSR